MANSVNETEMKLLFDRFINSFIEDRDPRMDLEIFALKQLQGSYLEEARAAILARLEKVPSSDAMWCAKAINLLDAVPMMQAWLEKIRSNPNSWRQAGEIAYNLYEFTNDVSYIPDVVETVKREGYSDFEYGVSWLQHMPLTEEGITAVWTKYEKGKTIKQPNSWRESCANFLREKIKQPVGQKFFRSLPEPEQKELLELIGESYNQRLERKFRLEKYIYGAERYSRDEVNRYSEYVRIGGSPVKGLTLHDIWKGHTRTIAHLKWSPDGRYLASSAQDDTLRIWPFDGTSAAKVLQPKKDYHYSRNEPQGVAWVAPKGEKIAVVYSNFQTASKDKYIMAEWNVALEKLDPPLYATPEQTPLHDLLYVPNLDSFFLCYWNALYLWDRKINQQQRILADYHGRFQAVSLSPNGKVLAIAYQELQDPKTGVAYSSGISGEGIPNEVLFYDVAAQKVIRRFNTGHIQNLNKLCWMPNAPVLAVASSDNSISVWNLQENKRIALLESDGFVGSITGIDFSANGILLASQSHEDQLLRIWRTDRWDEVVALRELGSSSFAFHPSAPVLASVCSLREANDNSSEDSPVGIRIWKFDYDAFLNNPPFMQEFRKREADLSTKLLRKEITEDLEYIRVGGSPAKGIRLRQVLKGHSDRIQQISWSPDGRQLASTADDKTIRIWDEESGECVFTLEEQEEVTRNAWSPKTRDLVYGGNKSIKLWNSTIPDPVVLVENDFLRLDSLTFSPDGKMLAVAYGYNTIQVLETSTWKEVSRKVFDSRSNARINLQWSEDSSQIVANPLIGFIQVLEAKTLKLAKVIAVPGDHNDLYGFSFGFAKFADKVAVAEEKKPIMIFDLLSGRLERECSESTSHASGLSFSTDGKVLVSWCHDNSVYFWRVETGQKLTSIHEYALRVIEPVFPCFHPVKPSLVTFCDKRRSMRVWDIDYKELLG